MEDQSKAEYMHLQVKSVNNMCKCNTDYATTLGKILENMRNKEFIKEEINSAQTYSLKQGITKFKEKGEAAVCKEMSQLHKREVFRPINPNKLSPHEKNKAMDSLIFLTKKKNGILKARACANGSIQRDYISKEEAMSPTAATESVLITATIDARQKRDVMIADVPNAFVQTEIPIDIKQERIIMKIKGILTKVLIDLSPNTYQDFIVIERNEPTLYVIMKKQFMGCSYQLCYFTKNLEETSKVLDSQ